MQTPRTPSSRLLLTLAVAAVLGGSTVAFGQGTTAPTTTVTLTTDWLSQAIDAELAGNLPAATGAMEKAAELETDPVRRQQIQLRLAILRADGNMADPQWQALSKGREGSAIAIAAAIYAPPKTVASLIGDNRNLFEQMLRGSSLLNAGQVEEADACFRAALNLTEDAREAKFITDRIVAAARKGGTLSKLADTWLAESNMPADRAVQLAAILRELNRTDDLLSLWRQQPPSLQKSAMATSRVFNDVVGAADEAGRLADVERLTHDTWAKSKAEPRWVNALVGVLLKQNRDADADTLIAESGRAATSARSVVVIAEIATAAGRDEAALATLARLGAFPPPERVAGMLFAASVERRRGNNAEANGYLKQAVDCAALDSSKLTSVARATEQCGDRPGAIALYRRLATADEDARHRLAWLLREEGSLPEAQAIWADLARTSSSKARRQDARSRMLELAGRNGTIGDLAAEIETKLAASTATAEEVDLLVDIYTGIRDPLSAAAVVRRAQAVLGGEVPSLHRLVQLYLQSGQFGLADRTLRQLLTVEPANALDTWQQVAALAIERSRPDDAREALGQIAQLAGSGTTNAEISAGIYSELGLHRQAADEYGRSLSNHPEKADLWLLWANAMKSDQRRDEAVARLARLAADAPSDDMFAVAVDGLLNLEAPRPAIRMARRAAVMRLATGNRRQLMMELIRDLSDAMGDKRMSTKVAEIGLLSAGEQRTELLRELISLAVAAGQPDQAIEYQRTLIAQGDEVPPQVFLDIGRRLLTDGRLVDAGRAFRRAEEAAEDDGTRMQVGMLYEKAGQTRLALRILEPFVRQLPDRIDLRVQVGGLQEQEGNWSAALDHYLAAMTSLVRQGGAAEALKPVVSFDAGISKSVTDSERYFEGLMRGVLYVARTPHDIDRVVDTMMSYVRQHPAFGATGPAADPALVDVVRLARLMMFRLHRPDAADAMDRQLHERYPLDKALADTAVADRMDSGLVLRASAIATEFGMPSPAAGKSSTQSSQLRPDDVAAQLPRLFLQDRANEAKAMLLATAATMPADPQAFTVLISAAHALGEKEMVWAWCDRWLSYVASAQAGQPDAAAITGCVRSCWPALDVPRRQELVRRLRQIASTANEKARPQMAMIAFQASVAVGDEPSQRVPLAIDAASVPYMSARLLAQLVAGVPEADRIRVLEVACRPVPAARRRPLLAEFIQINAASLQQQDLAAFTALVPVTPITEDANEPPSDNDQVWRGTGRSELWSAYADALVATDPVRAARAYASAGKTAEADRLALAELRRLIEARGLPAPAKLAAVARLLSPEAARTFLSEIDASSKPTSAQLLLGSALQDCLGDTDQSLQRLAEVFRLEPESAAVRRELILRYRSDLRSSGIRELFEPHINDPRVVDDFARSSLSAARRETEESADVFVSVFAIYPARPGETGSFSDRELSRFRAFHRLLREKRQYVTYPARKPSAAGGFIDYDRVTGGAVTSIYQVLAGQPWAPGEYLAVLRTTPSNAFEATGIVTGLAALKEESAAQIQRMLEEWIAHDALTANDRSLLVAMLQAGYQPPAEIAAALTADLQRSLAASAPADLDRAMAIADALQSLNHHLPDGVQRWMTAAKQVIRPASGKGEMGNASPGDEIADRNEVDNLLTLAARDSAAAEARFDNLCRRAMVAPATHPKLWLAAARVAAMRNDLPAFQQRFGLAIRATPQRSYNPVPEVELALTSTGLPDETRTMVFKAATQAITQIAIDSPADRARLARTLCLVGRWAAKNGSIDDAQEFLAAANQLAPFSGEHRLWLADLARVADLPDRAAQIETELASLKRLPNVRTATK